MPYPQKNTIVDATAGDQTWVSTELVNPAANAILADTGQLPAGDYEFYFVVTGSSSTIVPVRIEYRDAANAVTLNRLGCVTTGQTAQIPLGPIMINANERLRIIAVNAIAATVRSSITYRRVR